MKAKQWVKDYLDFAVPLVMAIVALNLVEVFIKLPYEYNPATYSHKFDDFFVIEAHLSIFMQQVNEGRLFLYSLIFMSVALLTRLFTNRLMINLNYPFQVILLAYIIIYGFMDRQSYIITFLFILVDGIIIFVIFRFLFKIFKIFFANLSSMITNILYAIILCLFVSAFFINKMGIMSSSIIYKSLFIAILCFVAISIIYIFIKEVYCVIIKKPRDSIIPQDIKQWKIDIKLKSQDAMEAYKEKMERKRIINDIANAIHKKKL